MTIYTVVTRVTSRCVYRIEARDSEEAETIVRDGADPDSETVEDVEFLGVDDNGGDEEEGDDWRDGQEDGL